MTRSSRYFKILTLLLCIGYAALPIVKSQTVEKQSQDQCVHKRTCYECIQMQNCAWCSQTDFGDRARCFQLGKDTMDICREEYIWNPENEQKIIVSRNLTRTSSRRGGAEMAYGDEMSSSKKGSAAGTKIVQITPQKVNLKLRINQPYRLQFKYSQADDYPVDLYYLMDLSNSMKDDQESLSKMGDLLSNTMKNITSNFKLGFGSFVDKLLMPYSSTFPKNLLVPCQGCAAPYGYHNDMPLSRNTHLFSDEVKRAAVSGNLDAAEGGFDAIMQAIVCREQIGWRDHARHILVFSTDAGFHYAGDGKLGGLIEPNDGECHLDENGYYTHSTLLDYPSVSQINHHVKKNAINIIFAVTNHQTQVYGKLIERIEGSSRAVLSGDSSNIVGLIEEEYNKISSSIEMKDNSTGSVKITYHSSCLNGGRGTPITTTKCDGLKVGDVVSFTAEIVVTSCPSDPKDWHQLIQIYPVGINESLLIDLEMLCSCPCEHPGHPDFEASSSKCHDHGQLKCGICECDRDYSGRNCECSLADVHGDNETILGCRADNTSQIDCNGRGNCVCGVCRCEKRSNPDEVISGKFCECDNFSCERPNQLLCSGLDHGSCQCGDCVCESGWSGTACDCQVSNDTCIPPSGGEICSGHGDCQCGSCICKETEEGHYSGKYCETCPTCLSFCTELKPCVQCQMYKMGPLKSQVDCAANCTAFNTTSVDKVIVDGKEDEYSCLFFDEDDCKFTFKYTLKDDIITEVQAQKERECPSKAFLMGIVFGLIAAVVVVGLATLLLWKLLITIHDQREFSRFEEERAKAKWNTGGNPIYKEATSTFKNPIFSMHRFSRS